MSRLLGLWSAGNARWQATRVGKAWQRYGAARGSVLAGGIAYFSLFSMFPALFVGFTVFGLVVGGRTDLRDDVVGYVNRSFGTVEIVGTAPGNGLVQLDTLIGDHVLTVTGIVAFVGLLVAGLGWLDAMREGIRAVFGRPPLGNPIVTKARDLAVLAVFGLGVLVSVVASVLVTSATGTVIGWLHLGHTPGTSFAVTLLPNLILMLIDTGIFLVFFRVLSGVRVPVADLFTGALGAGVGLALLKVSGGLLLTRAPANRFLAASTVLLGLLVWLNLIGRLTLLAAAWAAMTAQERGHLPDADPQDGKPTAAAGPSAPGPSTSGRSTSGARTAPVPATVSAGVVAGTTYSVRAQDRTVLAAGLVLGAGLLVAARVTRTGVRTAVEAARRALP